MGQQDILQNFQSFQSLHQKVEGPRLEENNTDLDKRSCSSVISKGSLTKGSKFQEISAENPCQKGLSNFLGFVFNGSSP